MKLKQPAQPLVFSFSGVSPLCGAVAALYGMTPPVRGALCLFRGRYVLAVFCRLGQRGRVLRTAGEFGACLGPGGVLYAFLEEHGRAISRDVVAGLGEALRKGNV